MRNKPWKWKRKWRAAGALCLGIWLGSAHSGAQERPGADAVRVQVRNRAGGTFGPTTMVMGGGIDTPVHQAEVQVAGPAGSLVKIGLTGITGHTHAKDPVLRIGGLVIGPGETKDVAIGAEGRVTGILTSTDGTKDDVVVHAGAAEAKVQHVWDNNEGADRWVQVPGDPPPAQVVQMHRAVLKRDERPVAGHLIEYFLERVEYTDEQGNQMCVTDHSDCPTSLAEWAVFVPFSVQTDYQGAMVVPLGVYSTATHFSCEFYDMDVWTP